MDPGCDSDNDGEEEAPTFDLDAQLVAAMGHGHSHRTSTRQAETAVTNAESSRASSFELRRTARASVDLSDQQQLGQVAVQPESGNAPVSEGANDSEDEAFNFDSQLAAAMGGPPAVDAPAANEPESAVPAASDFTPVGAAGDAAGSDSDSDSDVDEVFDVDKALAAAAAADTVASDVTRLDSRQAAAASLQSGGLAAPLNNAADDSDDDDDAAAVFDMDAALAAAIAAPAANNKVVVSQVGLAAPPPAVATDIGDNDNDDIFDFDKHLAAALVATPSTSAAALLPMEQLDPALRSLLISPAPGTAATLLPLAAPAVAAAAAAATSAGKTQGRLELPSSHIETDTVTLGTSQSLILQHVVELPQTSQDDDSDSDDAVDGGAGGFDMNAMLADAMKPTLAPPLPQQQQQQQAVTEAEQHNDAPAGATDDIALDIQATLGAAFANAAVAANLEMDSDGSDSVSDLQRAQLAGEARPSVGSDSDDDDDDDAKEGVEGGFDLDAQLNAAMSGTLDTWRASASADGDGDRSASPRPAAARGVPVPGLDLNLPVPEFEAQQQQQQQQASKSDHHASSADSDSDDEGDADAPGGMEFDLDAQIGAAMRSVSVTASRQASVLPIAPIQEARTVQQQTKQDDGATELQAMMANAMRQAALEVELEVDNGQLLGGADPASALGPEYDHDGLPMVYDYDTGLSGAAIAAEDAQTGEATKWDIVPDNPRTRPELRDDGDPDNAFNTARRANPQALHTSFPCGHSGCDRVVSAMSSLTCAASHADAHF